MRSFSTSFILFFTGLLLALTALLWGANAGWLLTCGYLFGPVLILAGLLRSEPDFWEAMRELIELVGRGIGWFVVAAHGFLVVYSYLLQPGSPAERAVCTAVRLLFFTGALTVILLIFTLLTCLQNRDWARRAR